MMKTPRNWFLAGSHPADYEIGIDVIVTPPGRQSAYLACRVEDPTGFGTLMQMCQAEKYKQKRVRMTSYIKTADVVDWSWVGMWMRIDGEGEKMLGFDNMQNRPIKGSTDWKKYSIVLDVPEDSKNLAFGILLYGKGKTWISDITFEVVGEDMPITDTNDQQQMLPERPMNLDFKS